MNKPVLDYILKQEEQKFADKATKEGLATALEKVIKVFDDLTTESSGLYEFHLNGDSIPWEDLLPGGRFEEWTAGLEEARAVLKKETENNEK